MLSTALRAGTSGAAKKSRKMKKGEITSSEILFSELSFLSQPQDFIKPRNTSNSSGEKGQSSLTPFNGTYLLYLPQVSDTSYLATTTSHNQVIAVPPYPRGGGLKPPQYSHAGFDRNQIIY